MNLASDMEVWMSLFLFDNKGTPLGAQKFTWRDLVGKPLSGLT